MRDILLAVPSRGRPQNIDRLIGTLDSTREAETDLLVGLDEDDPTRTQYPDPFARNVSYEVRPNLRKVTAWTNYLVGENIDGYRAFGQVGDDNVFSTPGWDIRIMEALEKTPFAFGNDQYPTRTPGTLSCHVFMRREVVQALGYFGPPSIAHMYVDVAWYAWGTACGITYLHDVLIPHLHYTAGAPHDQTYAVSFAGTSADLDAWHAYSRGGQLNADIRKLSGQEFTPEHLVQFNCDLNIPDRWPG